MRGALFAVGAAALLLLFLGIHNAWDAVAYYVLVHRVATGSEPRRPGTSGEDRPGSETQGAG